MHFRLRNVNHAFVTLVEMIHDKTLEVQHTSSRYGDCITVMEPVLATYNRPWERVLYNTARDANPFFHLYEALWMLAGRNDVAPLKYYVKRMEEFSDDGKTFNGAYGYRWRKAFNWNEVRDNPHTVDQLKVIINHLKALPVSRRAVLQMWNVEDDLLKIGPDNYSKDVCCNLSVMFGLREGPYDAPVGTPDNGCNYLDMTVTNRSNDMIWGMLGTNYVHFSLLQEYVAAHLGVQIGKYHHFTNNLHVYTNNWEPEKWLSPESMPVEPDPSVNILLNDDVEAFNMEVGPFVECHHSLDLTNDRELHVVTALYWKSKFLRFVAQPMMTAYHWYKRGKTDTAIRFAKAVADSQWNMAAIQWLERRRK